MFFRRFKNPFIKLLRTKRGKCALTNTECIVYFDRVLAEHLHQMHNLLLQHFTSNQFVILWAYRRNLNDDCVLLHDQKVPYSAFGAKTDLHLIKDQAEEIFNKHILSIPQDDMDTIFGMLIKFESLEQAMIVKLLDLPSKIVKEDDA